MHNPTGMAVDRGMDEGVGNAGMFTAERPIGAGHMRRKSSGWGMSGTVGAVQVVNAVAPEIESAWFQPLYLECSCPCD